MSTKIYDAFRLKENIELWSFLRKVKEQADKEVKNRLSIFLEKLMEGINPDCEPYKELDDLSDTYKRLNVAHGLILKGYKEASVDPVASIFNFDVSLTVREHKGRYYLITYNDFRSGIAGSLDFVEKLDELEDFHYQNSTDRPKGVTKKDWKHREQVWDEIYGNGEDWFFCLVLEILSYSGFYRYDPYYDKLFSSKYQKIITSEREKAKTKTVA
jgi:hypothetical protein